MNAGACEEGGERWRRAAERIVRLRAMRWAQQRTAARGQREAAVGPAGVQTRGMEAARQGADAGEAGTMRWAAGVWE